MSYPVDSAGLSILNTDFVGISGDELSASGARDYVEQGIIFIKKYFQPSDFGDLVPYAKAIVINDPVLFRDSVLNRFPEAYLAVNSGAGELYPIRTTIFDL